MTPIEITEAYKAVRELSGCILPYRVTRELHHLKKRLTEEFEVIFESERSLVTKYGGKPTKQGAHFEHPEDFEYFKDAYEAFMHQDAEVELPKVNLAAYADTLNISANAIDALEGLVIFEEV